VNAAGAVALDRVVAGRSSPQDIDLRRFRGAYVLRIESEGRQQARTVVLAR